jgi:hypothetical protein
LLDAFATSLAISFSLHLSSIAGFSLASVILLAALFTFVSLLAAMFASVSLMAALFAHVSLPLCSSTDFSSTSFWVTCLLLALQTC